jgi:hypothetical protein
MTAFQLWVSIVVARDLKGGGNAMTLLFRIASRTPVQQAWFPCSAMASGLDLGGLLQIARHE